MRPVFGLLKPGLSGFIENPEPRFIETTLVLVPALTGPQAPGDKRQRQTNNVLGLLKPGRATRLWFIETWFIWLY